MVSMFENNDSAWKAVAYMGQFSGAHSLHMNQSISYTSKRFYFNRNDNCKCPPIWGSGQYDNWRAGGSQGDQATLFSYLKVYVSEMRRQVSNSGSKYIDDRSMPVFLSWNGAKLESGQLSTAINAAWKKVGMEGHVSSTIFRKSTVTKVHGDHEEMKGYLADLMGHKTTTAV